MTGPESDDIRDGGEATSHGVGVASAPIGETRPKLALVQWRGDIGGAEVLSAALASSMRRFGVDAELVFVTSAEPLGERLADMDIPFRALGFTRGRDILRHPRRYCAGVAAGGPDGAILPQCSFIGTTLRAGGYSAPIVAVEHGAMLLERAMSRPARTLRLLSRLAATWADDIEVGVSDFMVEEMRKAPHARRLRRIYNGIDPERFQIDEPRLRAPGDGAVVGFAGRLIPGKGADDAVGAIARARTRASLTLQIAGDGPERERLAELARRVGVDDRIQFRGMISDIREFWRECDIAVFPSNQFVESFGMAALEAMACAVPVVATRNGAAPELVIDGVTGTVVPPGDISALGDALATYAERGELRGAHGAAGRARVIERFHIDRCAQSYLRCFGLPGGG